MENQGTFEPSIRVAQDERNQEDGIQLRGEQSLGTKSQFCSNYN